MATINRFTINNVTYTARPFDFELMCDLEAYGVSLANMGNMNLSLIRGYFAICAGLDKEDAAKEIQEHLINGGKFEDISSAMAKEMNESDFFRAISKRNEQGTETDHTESETESIPEKKRGRKPISNPGTGE